MRRASAVLIAALALAAPAGAAANTTHEGWPAFHAFWKNDRDRDTTRRGTSRNDELLGGHGDDVIHGLAGHDVIWGDYKPTGNDGVQHDTLYGGAGWDFIYASHWANVIYGGSGDDVIHDHFGRGLTDCGTGDDVVYVARHHRGRWKLRNCEHVYTATGQSAPAWWLARH